MGGVSGGSFLLNPELAPWDVLAAYRSNHKCFQHIPVQGPTAGKQESGSASSDYIRKIGNPKTRQTLRQPATLADDVTSTRTACTRAEQLPAPSAHVAELQRKVKNGAAAVPPDGINDDSTSRTHCLTKHHWDNATPSFDLT